MGSQDGRTGGGGGGWGVGLSVCVWGGGVEGDLCLGRKEVGAVDE